jgi:hypothetical protein
MSEHKNILFGVISHWVVYLTLFTMIPLAIGVVYWGAQKVVTYGSLPDRVEVIRTDMTNELAGFKADNDFQHAQLRQQMQNGFNHLEAKIDSLDKRKNGSLTMITNAPVTVVDP